MIKDKYELLLDTAANTYENIKFADTKATVLLAIYSAFLGFLGQKLIEMGTLDFGDPRACLLVASLIALIAGITLLIFTIWPRSKEHVGKGEGFLHPDRILNFSSVEQFAAYLNDKAKLEDSAIREQIVQLAYGRSKNNQRKYRLLRYALISGLVGLASGIVTIFLEILS